MAKAHRTGLRYAAPTAIHTHGAQAALFQAIEEHPTEPTGISTKTIKAARTHMALFFYHQTRHFRFVTDAYPVLSFAVVTVAGALLAVTSKASKSRFCYAAF